MPAAATRLDHLQARQHAERAVVDAAGGDAVDVAAGQHGRFVAVGGPGADDVADAVDVDPQPEVAHPRDDEVAAFLVGVGEREARDATGLERADLGQGVESGAQAREGQRERRHDRIMSR